MSIPDLGNDPVRALALEESGTLWAGSGTRGLLRLAGETSRIVLGHAEVGTVHDLAFDANGDLWVASENGLWQLNDGQVVSHYDETDGLSHRLVWSVRPAGDGIVWQEATVD